MDRVLDEALAQVDPGRRSILHLSPLQYQLDDAKGIKDPTGMFGETLSLELGVVTVESPHLKNLALAVERAHLSIAGFVMAPYAAARAVLADDEKTLGVTVVDMGGATTSFAVFQDNNLVIGGRGADWRPAHHQRHRARALHHHRPCRAHEDAVGLRPCKCRRRARDDFRAAAGRARRGHRAAGAEVDADRHHQAAARRDLRDAARQARGLRAPSTWPAAAWSSPAAPAS